MLKRNITITTLLAVFVICLTTPAVYLTVRNDFFKVLLSLPHRKIRNFLSRAVIDVSTNVAVNQVDLIYILGGSPSSLILKFITAHDISKNISYKSILMLSRPGITLYSKSKRRNLTNDEWAVLSMKAAGLPANKIAFIGMKDRFFGTYNEAENVSKFIIENNYNSVLLISSAYHTKRIRISFDKFLKGKPIKTYIIGSNETGTISELLVEFIKLKIYQYLLV